MIQIPIPYSPQSDDLIAIILLCCFFTTALVLAKAKKHIVQLGKNFIFHRERTNLFAISTSTEIHHTILLVLQFCILVGVSIFEYSYSVNPSPHAPSYSLLVAYSGICLASLLLKWIVYSLLGWTFFEKELKVRWMESYFTIIYYSSFSLLLFTLYAVYINSSKEIIIGTSCFLLITYKSLIFYKWLKFFFTNLFSLLLLILYFCALEIVPVIIIYKALFKINSFVI